MIGRDVRAQFARFVAVGGLGFLLDAGVFQGLVLLGLELGPARLVSAALAVTLTWALNRRMVFYTSGLTSRGSEYVRYVVVQALGLVVNLGVFFLLLRVSELSRQLPILALVGGAASAIALNYLGARYWAFRVRIGKT